MRSGIPSPCQIIRAALAPVQELWGPSHRMLFSTTICDSVCVLWPCGSRRRRGRRRQAELVESSPVFAIGNRQRVIAGAQSERVRKLPPRPGIDPPVVPHHPRTTVHPHPERVIVRGGSEDAREQAVRARLCDVDRIADMSHRAGGRSRGAVVTRLDSHVLRVGSRGIGGPIPQRAGLSAFRFEPDGLHLRGARDRRRRTLAVED